jgi:hypothetical protein
MKSVFIYFTSSIILLLPVLASAGQLDGLTFCRTVKAEGLFGQTSGDWTHCVSFTNNIARDDANTFFGNPPESFHYVVKGDSIIDGDSGKPSSYIIDGDDIMIAESKVVLSRKSKDTSNTSSNHEVPAYKNAIEVTCSNPSIASAKKCFDAGSELIQKVMGCALSKKNGPNICTPNEAAKGGISEGYAKPVRARKSTQTASWTCKFTTLNCGPVISEDSPCPSGYHLVYRGVHIEDARRPAWSRNLDAYCISD